MVNLVLYLHYTVVESKYMWRRGVENVGFIIVIELYGDKSLGIFGEVLHGFGS